MIYTSNDKRKITPKQLLFLCLFASIIAEMIIPEKIFACNAYSVKLYVAKSYSGVETSNDKLINVYEDTTYYVRVDWKESGSDGNFIIEVREILEDDSEELLASATVSDEQGSEQSKRLTVDTTPYSSALSIGKHNIYARVRRSGMDWEPNPEEGPPSNQYNSCTVYQVTLGYLEPIRITPELPI